MSYIAWLGSILLSLCAVPLVVQVYKNKHANDLNLTFLLMWFSGECLLLVYTLYLWDLALVFNYGFNVLLLTYILIVYYSTH